METLKIIWNNVISFVSDLHCYFFVVPKAQQLLLECVTIENESSSNEIYTQNNYTKNIIDNSFLNSLELKQKNKHFDKSDKKYTFLFKKEE